MRAETMAATATADMALPESERKASVPGTAPVLSIKDLTVAFRAGSGWKSVVNGIGFDIHAAETLAVVGESGSGKSVTAMSILGLNPRRSTLVTGRIDFAGRDLLQLSRPDLEQIRGRDIGMIFQEPMTSLNPVLKIGIQIAETLVLHRGMSWAAARAETIRLLDQVKIPSATARFDDYPHQFSGGMRQRAMIAIALACKPRLLIADEPTTALDVTIQQQILELIKELQDENRMAVLFITHDMGVMAEIADRTVVMYRGDQVETGTTRQILEGAQHSYTRALIAAVPRIGSMKGRPRPLAFSIVDPRTGIAGPVPERRDTVLREKAPVLQLDSVSVRFAIRAGFLSRVKAHVHAVENVSLKLLQGETLALVGESGCGKSTTGRSIMQLGTIAGGTIAVDGKDVSRFAGSEMFALRRQVQMIFQDPFSSLNPRVPVGKAIAAPMLLHRLTDARAAHRRVVELLELVGLDAGMAARLPHEFSGGQRQRLCIARALGVEPKVIIADESVSALDVSVKAQVINLMLDLQDRLGVAYLFISHDMAVVERLSHRVAVMYMGEIVETGPRAAIFSDPQHPYTRRLLAAVPVPDADRRNLRRDLSLVEIRSPLRAPGYVPAPRTYREVSPGHFVQDWQQADWPQA